MQRVFCAAENIEQYFETLEDHTEGILSALLLTASDSNSVTGFISTKSG
jgi:hypothetical protein